MRPIFLGAVLLIGLLQAPVTAQDRPVAFVHGFMSDGGTWTTAANALKARLAIAPVTPTLSSSERLDHQTDQLQAMLGWMPGSTIAIGHSNGGLISREWRRRRPLAGIVTLSTPHYGAPLVMRAQEFGGFNLRAFDFVSSIYTAFGGDYNLWSWTWATLQVVTSFANGMSAQAAGHLATTLGVAVWKPALTQMYPGSSFVQTLNGSANLAQEAATLAGRVGIVTVAKDYYKGGIFRAAAPELADYVSDSSWAAASLLEATAVSVIARTGSYAHAQRLWDLAWWFRMHEELWCRAVSDPAPLSVGRCGPNDSVVPVVSQRYPGGSNVEYSNTPVHTRQTNGGAENAIYPILVNTFGVAVRAGGGGGGVPTPSGSSTLYPGQRLYPHQSLVSPNGRVRLTYQGDGNLVMTLDGHPVWASMTTGPNYAEMQPDGNFVIYPGDGTPVWATNTDMNPGAVLTVSDDVTVSVYIPGGLLLWRATQES